MHVALAFWAQWRRRVPQFWSESDHGALPCGESQGSPWGDRSRAHVGIPQVGTLALLALLALAASCVPQLELPCDTSTILSVDCNTFYPWISLEMQVRTFVLTFV